jgi:hypothetical protein
MNITDKLYNWRVGETILSDHLLIEFNIGKGSHSKVSVWNYNKADWGLFRDKAGAYNTPGSSGPWTQGRIKR